MFNRNIKNILVTGGAGFIGGALIRKILIDSSVKIFNLDKIGYASDLTSINKVIANSSHNINTKYEHLKVDLANEEQTNNAIKYAKPDIIFHLAAESHVDRSIDSPKQFIGSNINGTFNLLEASRKYWEDLENNKKNIFKFIHISTDEVFGSLCEGGKFNENSRYSPNSPYSASKASSDHLVNSWNHTYNLPTIITNCTNNFGPWQYPEKLIPVIINNALNEKIIPIYGDGKNIRDWLYVEDHINAIILVSQKGIIGNSYCIGAEEEKTNLELAHAICKILDEEKPSNYPHKNLIEFVEDRKGHDKRYAIDPSKIKRELGWYPINSFEENIRSTVKWYIKNQLWSKKVKEIVY